MRVLIDTNVFLWGIQHEDRLSRRVQALLPKSDVWISVASLWGIITKVKVGKLILPAPVGDYLGKIESERCFDSSDHICACKALGGITAPPSRSV
jgi:PIN domain nuclease of toxin-antitoxin system